MAAAGRGRWLTALFPTSAAAGRALQMTGSFKIDGSGNVQLTEEDGIDSAPVTVQLPGGERVPFLFSVKELNAKVRRAQGRAGQGAAEVGATGPCLYGKEGSRGDGEQGLYGTWEFERACVGGGSFAGVGGSAPAAGLGTWLPAVPEVPLWGMLSIAGVAPDGRLLAWWRGGEGRHCHAATCSDRGPAGCTSKDPCCTAAMLANQGIPPHCCLAD